MHSSMGGIHLVRRDTAQHAPHRKPVPGRTGLAAERITAGVLLIMCIAAVFV
jgi:hypothetical protein